jgi:hypothetical protein
MLFKVDRRLDEVKRREEGFLRMLEAHKQRVEAEQQMKKAGGKGKSQTRC